MNEVLANLARGAPLVALLVVLADLFALPRPRIGVPARSASGSLVLLLTALIAFALLLALTGAPAVAGISVAVMFAALSLISNIKRRVLGEPLVFSDLALIGAVFQHPQFYISALRPWQIAVLIAGLGGVIAPLSVLATGEIAPRAGGLVLALAGWGGLAVALPRAVRSLSTPIPDPERDVARLGLVPALLAQWTAWRRTGDPDPCVAERIGGSSGQLVVIVQCESFTDPLAVFGNAETTLPGLSRARALAWQSGRLLVPGFGAYTMRTEYGVLFGRDEAQLGARRFDPFLTARGEASWALPNRLDPAQWDTVFVHPHDLRFYGRDRLMPESGFATLVGEDSFAPPAPGEGRYVTDAAVTDRILALAAGGSRASLIYAVTIENHGPWPASDRHGDCPAAPYLRLLRRSDAMLARLVEELPRIGRPVTLCFFGDHRPSIPGASEPGPERHTPYVILRFDANGAVLPDGGRERDLTPAELHHALLEAIGSGEAQGEQDAVAQGARQEAIEPAQQQEAPRHH
ncbi:MAG: LTA synthase family protein [Erythrobacter sp.]